MPVLNLAQVLTGTGAELYRTTPTGVIRGVLSPSDLGRSVTGFTTSSRDVIRGNIFVALKGECADGHDFAGEALKAGAGGAIVERPIEGDLPPDRHLLISRSPLKSVQDLASYWRRKHELCVIGVTGSLGKTTVKDAVAQALVPLGAASVLKSEGNHNTEIGLPLELLKLTDDHKVAVLEMGMYQRGDIALLADIAAPSVGIITNVQSNHLERTGSIERTAQGKAELVHALPESGLAILNGDDPLVSAMGAATAARSVRYGVSGQADFVASDVAGYGRLGFQALLRHGSRRLRLRCPTPGVHNAVNLLPALATAHYLGIPWVDIRRALEEFRLSSRGAFIPGPHGSTLLDDRYNASAASVIAALNLLGEEPGRHIALLGEMYELGPAAEEEHRAVGRHCGNLDRLILLGSRTEWIAEDARKAGLQAELIIRVDDNEQAVKAAENLLSPGDVMLIKGSRGLHLETVVSALTADASMERA
jgi:UDP-N-acetylmuramoyl-tripeptide--D-alanyl-D-alanine ligase